MSNLFISAYGRSNVGKKRGNNEDNFYISGVTVDSALDITARAKSTSETAFAIFDGMGGEAAGEKASQATAVTYGQKLSLMLDEDFSPISVQDTVEAANKKVCDETRVLGKRMGCTFVSAGFKNDTIYVSNVGDSRAYLLRNGMLHCVSKDHTVAQSMVDSGVISYEDSQRIKEKHKLTQHIGIFPEEMIIEPYYKNIAAQRGDIILLCSDGLTDMLTDDDIANILREGGTEEQITNALVESALANGGKDNVTVIVGKVDVNEAMVPVVNSFEDASTKSNVNFKLLAIIGGAVVLVLVGVIVALLLGGKGDSDVAKPTTDETTNGNGQTSVITTIRSLEDEGSDSIMNTTNVDEQNTTAPAVTEPSQDESNGNDDEANSSSGNNVGTTQPPTQAPIQVPAETTTEAPAETPTETPTEADTIYENG